MVVVKASQWVWSSSGATIGLLVVGIPKPWSLQAMETFTLLAFYFFPEGRMKLNQPGLGFTSSVER